MKLYSFLLLWVENYKRGEGGEIMSNPEKKIHYLAFYLPPKGILDHISPTYVQAIVFVRKDKQVDKEEIKSIFRSATRIERHRVVEEAQLKDLLNEIKKIRN